MVLCMGYVRTCILSFYLCEIFFSGKIQLDRKSKCKVIDPCTHDVDVEDRILENNTSDITFYIIYI